MVAEVTAHTRRSSSTQPLLILFQTSHYRTFKAYYTQHVQVHLRAEFPQLVSYSRFVELVPTVLLPLVAYLHTQMGTCTGISFVDSTPLAVCHNARIPRHRVFTVDAARGKTSLGWFYGFKLHLVVNDRGELLSFCLTRGNVDDRQPLPRCSSASSDSSAGSSATRATSRSRSPSNCWSSKASSSSSAYARTCATAW
jgi:hypothetical protein